MSAKNKLGIHNEWFRSIKKTTCDCGRKKTECFSWGQYIHGKWNTIQYFCKNCFIEIVSKLLAHKKSCGCEFRLNPKSGQVLPEWIKLPDTCEINYVA